MADTESQCCVCFDCGETLILECSHTIHEKCAESLISLECPYCQVEVEWLPSIKEKILENITKYKNILVEEDARNVQRQIENSQRIPLNVEVTLALKFLVENGIPLRYIPSKIIIKKSSCMQPGILFTSILTKILVNVVNDIQDFEDDDSDGGTHTEESHLEDEYPFEEEDVYYADIKREVKFI